MKRLLSLLARNPATPPEAKLCQQHNQKMYPQIKADEFCQTCDLEICYLCNNKHVEQGHFVGVSKHCYHKTETEQMSLPDAFSSEQKNYKPLLNEFNHGALVSFNWQGAKCPCGTQLDTGANSAICVACGTATCSLECHHHYAEEKHECRFHENFSVKSSDRSMRSILLKNVNMLYNQGLSKGTPVNMTSQHFIMGFLSNSGNLIYLQRGYRQYGNPLASTLSSMSTLQPHAALDAEVNLFRLCKCICGPCVERGHHPVINCQHKCKSEFMMNSKTKYQRLREVNRDPAVLKPCTCQCEFCTSGITSFSHQRIDCIQRCPHSPLYVG